MACIYKITNLVNNKVYIGKTLKTAEERWKEHCRACRRLRCEKRPLYDAMNKYGVENFICELIEECSVENINDREIYWIEHYNSFHYGYNATLGGDGKPYVDYDLIYQLFNDGKIMTEISIITGHDIATIRKGLNNMGVSLEERKNRGINVLKKPVIMLDKDTNEELRRFNSITEAENSLEGNSKGHINQVCKGKRKTAYGYKWRYADENNDS